MEPPVVMANRFSAVHVFVFRGQTFRVHDHALERLPYLYARCGHWMMAQKEETDEKEEAICVIDHEQIPPFPPYRVDSGDNYSYSCRMMADDCEAFVHWAYTDDVDTLLRTLLPRKSRETIRAMVQFLNIRHLDGEIKRRLWTERLLGIGKLVWDKTSAMPSATNNWVRQRPWTTQWLQRIARIAFLAWMFPGIIYFFVMKLVWVMTMGCFLGTLMLSVGFPDRFVGGVAIIENTTTMATFRHYILSLSDAPRGNVTNEARLVPATPLANLLYMLTEILRPIEAFSKIIIKITNVINQGVDRATESLGFDK